ncbi:MAG TPA: GNAT family N-acetyltransferase [Anaerolineales bacterium]|nr:GNAT family N-acetyltransferase [Anaerolineales bacterium]
MLSERIEKVETSSLPEPLRATLAAFLDDFQTLLEEPHLIYPFYLRRMLEIAVDEMVEKDSSQNRWWEVALYLAANWAKTRGEAGQITLERIKSLHPLMADYFPLDDSEVTLQEITWDTQFGVLMLSETLTGPKRNFVASNAISLAQAHLSDQAWFRAIHAGHVPIGFVMLEIDEEKPQYYVWRFMIAEPYHGRGYGRKAMEAIKAHVRTLPNATELYLSYGQGEGSPEGFYKKLGFKETGEMDEDEAIAKIAL